MVGHTDPDEPGGTAYITLDLENNWTFESEELRYRVLDYVDEYIELVDSLGVPVTVFVVGELLEDRPYVVQRLDDELDVEFHLHSYSHDMHGHVDIRREIRKGVAAFERVFGEKPRGYRAPRFIIEEGERAALSEAGFEFDSSVCPSYRPGVYNNLGEANEPYVPAEAPDLLEIPVSIHPWFRVPFAQSYLRLLRSPYQWALKRSPLPDPLVFDSHLHDFFHTSAHNNLEGVRRFLFNNNIDDSTRLFESFVRLLRDRGYQFRKLSAITERTEPL